MAKAYTPPPTGGRHTRGIQAPKHKVKQPYRGTFGSK